MAVRSWEEDDLHKRPAVASVRLCYVMCDCLLVTCEAFVIIVTGFKLKYVVKRNFVLC